MPEIPASPPPQVVAFIPARGGSKGIPGKNIRTIAGKPLIRWVLEAASNCPEIDQVILSTDDEAIAAAAMNPPLPKFRLHRRHPDTATDTASTESAMVEFAQSTAFETMVLIQATSPLLTAQDLSRGIQHFHASGADTLLSAVPQHRFLWTRAPDGLAHPQNYLPEQRPRRQDFNGHFVENGAFYITPRSGLLQHQSRLYGKIALYEMPAESYQELDEPSDWAIVETLLLQRTASQKTSLRERLQAVRLFLTDVDGVLTDSGMYYSENGDELKKFNTRDAVGLRRLREHGIRVGIITTENTRIVENRAKKMNVDFLFQGCRDKTVPFQHLLRELNLTPEQTAFIGDDENDKSLLALVGLAATPADGHPCLRGVVDLTCAMPGGRGAVRELAELILQAQSPPA